MDDRWAVPLLIGIPLLVVAAYLLAWKSKQRMVRASATSALIVIIGIAMFWIT